MRQAAIWMYHARPGHVDDGQVLPNGVALTREASWLQSQLDEDKKLSPRYPASPVARAQLPAAIRTHQCPTDSSDEAQNFSVNKVTDTGKAALVASFT
jgi:hypothetical protein